MPTTGKKIRKPLPTRSIKGRKRRSNKPRSRATSADCDIKTTIRYLSKLSAYNTNLGLMLEGKSEELLSRRELKRIKGRVQLIFTSPPFPLNRKKKYDNLKGEEYKNWLASYAELFSELLCPTGSIVLELGNAWEQGSPVMSTLAIESLLAFKNAANFYLCQQFVCHNPSRLPSPAQWVNVERSRLKDSYTNVWWFSKTPYPKADNRRVLQPYSDAMNRLLKRGTYNSGRRPSQHHIGERSFLKNNGGAIPSNVLIISNTRANDNYLRYCESKNLQTHPARMPLELPEFFIKFLTEEADLVVDPFGGSNTTGAAAEKYNRHWITCEPIREYIKGSKARFEKKKTSV